MHKGTSRALQQGLRSQSVCCHLVRGRFTSQLAIEDRLLTLHSEQSSRCFVSRGAPCEDTFAYALLIGHFSASCAHSFAPAPYASHAPVRGYIGRRGPHHPSPFSASELGKTQKARGKESRSWGTHRSSGYFPGTVTSPFSLELWSLWVLHVWGLQSSTVMWRRWIQNSFTKGCVCSGGRE